MPAGSRRRRSQRLNQIEQDNEEPAAGWQQRLERVENGLGQLDELRELLQNINTNTNNNVMVEEREVDHRCYRAEKPACNPRLLMENRILRNLSNNLLTVAH